nr:hypothetical protein [Candidatus Freyarchaeota archaeon]
MYRLNRDDGASALVTIFLVVVILLAVFGGYLIIAGINARIDQSNALATQAYTVAYEAYNKPPYSPPYLYDCDVVDIGVGDTNVTINLTQTGTYISYFFTPNWTTTTTAPLVYSANVTWTNNTASMTFIHTLGVVPDSVSFIGSWDSVITITSWTENNVTLTAVTKPTSGDTWGILTCIDENGTVITLTPLITLLGFNEGINATLGWAAIYAPTANSSLAYGFVYAG